MNNIYTTNHDDSAFDVLPNDMLAKRVWAMILILVVSLTAVSFPGVSRKVRFLRIPHVVFFIGKHFGTGVILATAFCHLLQDAYISLQDPEVRKGTDVARWTGLIILGSLLTIFLVEYISTSYVDRLNANPSVPSSPTESPSRAASPSPPTPLPLPPLASVIQDNDAVSERTPLLATPATAPIRSIPTSPRSTSPSPPATARTGIPIARYRSSSLHEPSSPNPYLPLVHSTNPRYISILGDRDHHRCCCTHDEFCGSLRRERTARRGSQSSGRKKYGHVGAGEGEGERSEGTAKVKVKVKNKRASIVGIFAPRQFVHHHRHDLDIEWGRGSEHRHSHGSAHANARSEDSGHAYHHHDLEFLDEEEGEGVTTVGRRKQVVGILVLQLGIMIHSLVIGLTLSITPKADFTSLVTAIFFHQLFEGLSLGIRIASLPPPTNKSSRSLLAPALSALFAVTTPVGILIGLLSLGGGQGVHLRLTQGLMSAISAGMLIYAACVEMLAADFVNDPHMHMGVGGVRRQAVALASLLCGVLLMTLVD